MKPRLEGMSRSDLAPALGGAASLMGLWCALAGCLAHDSMESPGDPGELPACRQLSDCAIGDSCIAHRCVPPSGEGASPPRATVPARAVFISAATREPGAVIRLTEGERGAGPPTVRWIDDHWLVVWPSSSSERERRAGRSGTFIEAVQVSADGKVGGRRLREAPAAAAARLTIAEDGTVGVLDGSTGCALEVLDRNLAPTSAPRSIECGRDSHSAAIAPVPGSDEWLVAYGAGELRGEYLVGRYRPISGAWTVPPIALGLRTEYDALDVFTVGSDAVVMWGNAVGSSITAIPALAAATVPADRPFALPTQWLGVKVIGSAASFALARPSGRALAFAMDGDGVWATPIGPDGGLAPVFVAASRIKNGKPGVAFAPELGATGVCYATGTGPFTGASDRHDGVSFVLVAGDGAPLGIPLVIAHELLVMGGTDCAWSGDAFLIVWWDIEPDLGRGTMEELKAMVIRPL